MSVTRRKSSAAPVVAVGKDFVGCDVVLILDVLNNGSGLSGSDAMDWTKKIPTPHRNDLIGPIAG
jgi:hypothetical protein